MAIEIIRDQTDLDVFHSDVEDIRLGLVPTMGALHDGHRRLIEASLEECDRTVCSIFVNPTQFNDPGDFIHYPKKVEKDISFLDSIGCQYAFVPDEALVYPPNLPRLIDYYDPLFDVLEGAFRPKHFHGVVTVVERLLRLIRPAKAYFGLKDYQQYIIVKRAFKDLIPPVEIVGVETVREESGLAKSSRNERLLPPEQEKAIGIIEALRLTANAVGQESIEEACVRAMKLMKEKGLKPEYVSVARADDLEPLKDWENKSSHVVMAAGFAGDVRLIDNLRF